LIGTGEACRRDSNVSEYIVPRKIYLVVCAALLGLTFATYRLALLDLGPWNVVAALTIASCKALLVTLFFMHVRYSPRRTQLVILAGLFWLGLLLFLTMTDYVARGWLGRGA